MKFKAAFNFVLQWLLIVNEDLLILCVESVPEQARVCSLVSLYVNIADTVNRGYFESRGVIDSGLLYMDNAKKLLI